MRPIRTLVITPQYAPDLGPSAPIYTDLCEDLQRMGCDVTVVTGFPNYAGSDLNYSPARGFFEEEMLNGVRILRSYVYRVPKSSLWQRLLYYASFNLFATIAASRTGKPDIVLADAPTLWSGLPLLATAILPRIPFIYVVHDIYPDVMQRLGIVNNLPILNFIGRVEAYFYRRSVCVSVLSPGFENNLLKKGVSRAKIAVIPVCVDVDFIRPLPRENPVREAWGLGEKFVVLYAGNIGLSQGLDTTLKAARLLSGYPEIVFALAGEGATKGLLQQAAREDGLENVKFFSFLPRSEVPFIYASADVSLVSLKRDIVVESVPSKTYTIMASGRPVVATIHPDSEVGRLLAQSQCGLCVPPGDADALAQAILRLYEDPSLRAQMGQCGRDHVVQHYSRQVAAKQYYELIRHSTNGAGH